MTRSGRPTATPSRAPATATPASKGLNALIAALSTPAAAPVIVATRLRKGSANSARGAARLVADALQDQPGLRRERAAGRAGGLGVLRPRRRRRDRPGRCAVLDHRPPGRRGASGRSPRSARMRGRRSATRTPSSTSSSGSGSATPRSPRCRSPRSPPAARSTPSPRG